MRWQLVDRLLDFEPWHYLSALKYGTLEEYFLLSIWGEPSCGPGLFILESALQAARWLVEASSNFQLTWQPKSVENFSLIAPNKQNDPSPKTPTQGLLPAEGVIWIIKTAYREATKIGFLASSAKITPIKSPDDTYQELKANFLTADNFADLKSPPYLPVKETWAPLQITGSLVSLEDYYLGSYRQELFQELSSKKRQLP